MILEFFILFIGVIWLVFRKTGEDWNLSRGRTVQDEYGKRFHSYVEQYTATDDEDKIADFVINCGVTYNPETFYDTLNWYFFQLTDPTYEKRTLYGRIRDYQGLHAKDFASLVKDDLDYAFGTGSMLIVNGKYTPKNNIHFRVKDGNRFLPYHGTKLMKMLILAKMGKIPRNASYGCAGRDFSTSDDAECRLLERIERSLLEHGVPADFVITGQYGTSRNFAHRQCLLSNSGEKAW